MSSDYGTLWAACVIGLGLHYESRPPLSVLPRRFVVMVGILLAALWMALGHPGYWPWFRVGWGISGTVLTVQAARFLSQRDHRQAWVAPLEGFMGLAGLSLASGNTWAVVSGVAIGWLWPIAMGPWWEPFRQRLRPWSAVSLGGVGLRYLVWAVAGPGFWDHIPSLWWVVPWLISWEVLMRFGVVRES